MENLPVGKQPQAPNRIPNAVYKYLSKDETISTHVNKGDRDDRTPGAIDPSHCL